MPLPDRYLTIGEFKPQIQNDTETIKAGILLTITTNLLNTNIPSILSGFNKGMELNV